MESRNSALFYRKKIKVLSRNSGIVTENLGAQRLINLEIPALVRSLKSSNVELG